MLNTRNFFLLFVLYVNLNSCHTDSFQGTKRYFTTDRTVYKAGEVIKLTAVIEADEEREIRFYDNYKNLRINFSAEGGALTYTSDNGTPDTTVTAYTIKPEHPFEKVFRIYTQERGDSLLLSIPELDYTGVLPSHQILDLGIKLRIGGIAIPIDAGTGDSLDDYFKAAEVSIVR